MTALTAAELSKIGKDAAIALYVGDTTKKDKPVFDTTHPSKAGAKRFAELFLAEVTSLKLPVAALFK
jgi:lysophospholipase L1-like esterase